MFGFLRRLSLRAKRTEAPCPYLHEFADPQAELAALYRMRLASAWPVDQPLVLISQVQRSGGTLLSQLFDGHPECHVHPHELYIGWPHKWNWPDINLEDGPEQWFAQLFEEFLPGFLREGYSKAPKEITKNREYFNFALLPNLQRVLFVELAAARDIRKQRDVLDCYMTSFFNAWLDYRDLRVPKKLIAAFTPRTNMFEDSVARFFRDYPDGYMISLVRDPRTWYVSIRRQRPHKYGDVSTAIELWKQSSEATLANVRQRPGRVIALAFEDLVAHTEATMRKLCGLLGLGFDEVLLTPTFQGMPIRANSSFDVKEYGVIRAPLQRESGLAKEDRDLIEERAVPLYERLAQMAREGPESVT